MRPKEQPLFFSISAPHDNIIKGNSRRRSTDCRRCCEALTGCNSTAVHREARSCADSLIVDFSERRQDACAINTCVGKQGARVCVCVWWRGGRPCCLTHAAHVSRRILSSEQNG